jgi:hypothetical protein
VSSSGEAGRRDDVCTATRRLTSLGGFTRRAYLALQQHAQMFEGLGMRVQDEVDGEILLSVDPDRCFTLHLGYRISRKLLAKIHHLRMTARFAPTAANPAPRYRLDLKARSLVSAPRELVVSGPGITEGRKIADFLAAAGVVSELEDRMDVESLSVNWSPGTGSYTVTLEPYPGSHVLMLLPPMAYTIRLKDTEVSAIYRFFRGLSELLR